VSDIPIWLVFLLLLAAMLASAELGHSFGRRVHAETGDTPAYIGTVVAAVLGLLGLLLGFTFAMSSARYEERRALVLKESNAIGTAYLRSQLLPEPQRGAAAALFRRYVDVRLEIVASIHDRPRVEALFRETDAIHAQLWSDGVAVAARGEDLPVVTLYLDSLNAVIDVNAERVAAHRNRVPASIFVVLLIVSLLGILLTGYAAGVGGHRWAMARSVAALLITLVIVLIVDLHRPFDGSVTISQQSMTDLRNSMPQP